MPCIKCGRKAPENQVFCDACLEDMAAYPVKPGTPIQFPHRSEAPAAKKRAARRKRDLKPEEQIRRLRSAIRWLTLALVVTLIAFCLAAAAMLSLLDRLEDQAQQQTGPIGQNYTVITDDGK